MLVKPATTVYFLLNVYYSPLNTVNLTKAIAVVISFYHDRHICIGKHKTIIKCCIVCRKWCFGHRSVQQVCKGLKSSRALCIVILLAKVLRKYFFFERVWPHLGTIYLLQMNISVASFLLNVLLTQLIYLCTSRSVFFTLIVFYGLDLRRHIGNYFIIFDCR